MPPQLNLAENYGFKLGTICALPDGMATSSEAFAAILRAIRSGKSDGSSRAVAAPLQRVEAPNSAPATGPSAGRSGYSCEETQC